MGNDASALCNEDVPETPKQQSQKGGKSAQLRFQVDGYKEIRKEIHYEYTLMASRVNWLLASQTFLFTALAIAIPKDKLTHDISQSALSKIAPIIGICSTWLISSAIIANILRIWDWKRIQRTILPSVEYVIPRFPRDSLPGLGLLPPVGLPMMFFSLWGYVLFAGFDWFSISRTLSGILFSLIGEVSVWSAAFFFYCMDEDVSAAIFKRPINLIKRHRGLVFVISILAFIGLIFYSILR